MRLDNLRAVKQRIAEIEQRFAEPMQAGLPPHSASRSSSRFTSFLQNARSAATAKQPCPSELDGIIREAGNKYGISPAVIKSVIQAESGFRQSAVSRAGALGLMQLMPGTARGLGVNPMDPVQNIDGGVRYLRQQLDRFRSLDQALAAYNAGPGAVIKYGGIPPYTETQNYVQKVMNSIDIFTGGE